MWSLKVPWIVWKCLKVFFIWKYTTLRNALQYLWYKDGDLFMSAHWPTICTFLAQIVELGFLCTKFWSFLKPICYLSGPFAHCSFLWVPPLVPRCGDTHQTHNACHLTSKMGCTSAKIFWIASRFALTLFTWNCQVWVLSKGKH
jgi:hypothetical protein